MQDNHNKQWQEASETQLTENSSLADDEATSQEGER